MNVLQRCIFTADVHLKRFASLSNTQVTALKHERIYFFYLLTIFSPAALDRAV